MKRKRILLMIAVVFSISFLFPTQGKVEALFPLGGTQPKPGTHPPIITHTYAVGGGQYGDILKLYIEADDPDGDMFIIATVVDQVGHGYYPTNWTFIKPKNQRHLIGYLQWNTFSTKVSSIKEWTYITIQVSIIDKAGNESNVIVFPHTFQTGIRSKPQPTAPFDQGNIERLGHIMIDLVDPNDHQTKIWPE